MAKGKQQEQQGQRGGWYGKDWEPTSEVRRLRAEGVSALAVRQHAAGSSEVPLTSQQERTAKRRFQHSAGKLQQACHRRFPEQRMRQKLERIDMPLFPRVRASRAVAMLSRLASLGPPRVAAAVLRTLWSGWCTSRRFGRRSTCLFCGTEDGDSVEHASICKVLACFGRDYLLLPYHTTPGPRRVGFLLLEAASQLVDEGLLLGALRITSAYHLHCKFRRGPRVHRGPDWVRRALEQGVKEAVQGHPKATAILDKRWVTHQVSPPFHR